MIGGVLKCLDSLDYILMVVKASENRLPESAKTVYKRIHSLYAQDISERVIPMFTFADGNEPKEAIASIKSSGIQISDKYFKFNNSAMWTSK